MHWAGDTDRPVPENQEISGLRLEKNILENMTKDFRKHTTRWVNSIQDVEGKISHWMIWRTCWISIGNTNGNTVQAQNPSKEAAIAAKWEQRPNPSTLANQLICTLLHVIPQVFIYNGEDGRAHLHLTSGPAGYDELLLFSLPCWDRHCGLHDSWTSALLWGTKT